MNAVTIERCVLCGYPVRKPGEKYCLRHDVAALIAEGYFKALARMKKATPDTPGRQNQNKGV
jgi:hypothetical protein